MSTPNPPSAHDHPAPSKWRKKPVVIEAVQFNGDNGPDIVNWAHNGLPPEANSVIRLGYPGYLYVRTLEGTMEAYPNDWIIKGIKGEFYPCKPDIFNATYEPA